MNEKSLSRKLNKEAKERNEMISDALEAMNSYSEDLIKKDSVLEKYRISEINYKTTIKELNEYIDIYKTKTNELEEEKEKNEKEIISLRKKFLKNDADLTSLKSILDNFIHEYGIEKISEVTKIEQEKIKKLLED